MLLFGCVLLIFARALQFLATNNNSAAAITSTTMNISVFSIILLFLLAEWIINKTAALPSTFGKPSTPSFFHSNPQPIRFKKLGPIKTNLGDGHIMVQFPIVQLAISANYNLRIALAGEKFNPAQYRTLRITNEHTLATVEAILDGLGLTPVYHRMSRDSFHNFQEPDFSNPMSIFPPSSPDSSTTAVSNSNLSPYESNRRKRFLGILTGLAFSVIAASAIGLYGTHDLIAIKDALGDTNKRINLLAAAVETSHTQIGLLMGSVTNLKDAIVKNQLQTSRHQAVSDLTIQTGLAVNHAATCVQAIVQGHLEPSSLPANASKSAINHLVKQAARHRLIPVVTRPQDLSLMPVSFIATELGTLTAFIHIPLTSPKYDMNLYRLTSLPISTNNGFFRIDVSNVYLAVNLHPSNTFFTLSDSDFDKCKRINDQFVCGHMYKLLKADETEAGPNEDRCIFSLFTNSGSTISKYCPMIEAVDQAAVSQVDDNEFTLFSLTSAQVQVTCDHDLSLSQLTSFSGLLHLHLPLGCTAETKGSLISPHVTIQGREIASTVYAPSVLAQFANLSADALETAKAARQSIAATMDASNKAAEALAKSTKLQEVFSGNEPIALSLFSILIIFGIILFCVATALFLYRKKLMSANRVNKFLEDERDKAKNSDGTVTYQRYPSPNITLNTIPTDISFSAPANPDSTSLNISVPRPMSILNPRGIRTNSSLPTTSTHDTPINFPKAQDLNLSRIQTAHSSADSSMYPTAPPSDDSSVMDQSNTTRHVSFDSNEPDHTLVERTRRLNPDPPHQQHTKNTTRERRP